MFKDGDRWHGHSWRHRLVDGTRFFFRYSLMFSHSNLFWFFSLLSSGIGCDSVPYISSSKSGSVSGFLVLSHTFQNVQPCISNHSVPQITVFLVRQTAHNMHVACIASCIHVTKNSNNALTTAGFTPCLAHAIITFGGFVTLGNKTVVLYRRGPCHINRPAPTDANATIQDSTCWIL